MNQHGMVRHMNHTRTLSLWLTAVIALMMLSGAWGGGDNSGGNNSDDDDADKTLYRKDTTGNGWNASAKGESSNRPVQPGKSAFTVRIYDGQLRVDQPVDLEGRAIATDVVTEVETCADGNMRISALMLGSWRYQLDGSCEDFRRGGKITVEQADGGTVIRQDNNVRKESGQSRVILCDPKTWSCETVVE